jgi:ABC-type phosphate transport system substrate-binding protein
MSRLFRIGSWLLAFAALSPANAASGEVAVIAHKSVPAEAITRSQLLDVYSGDVKEWSNGERIVLADLDVRNVVTDAFYGFLGKPPSRMKTIWMKNMLSGEGDPPASFTSEQELLDWVASTPGAIGYVDRGLVKGDVITLAVIPYEKPRR